MLAAALDLAPLQANAQLGGRCAFAQQEHSGAVRLTRLLCQTKRKVAMAWC